MKFGWLHLRATRVRSTTPTGSMPNVSARVLALPRGWLESCVGNQFRPVIYKRALEWLQWRVETLGIDPVGVPSSARAWPTRCNQPNSLGKKR
jgi:hypothetical protein